ncbi:virulence factor lipase N-terminal [Marinobacter gudaonensis]|uniref:Virulence factor lipase N-terminal n=1 Tax=Marinobacter gudaonensis TaxID=375760 RepID=A0A1I6HUS1_9GAMM|nr:hypothetical protein [Marinobacter gudaonensis]SFR58194.1 virulence factor lipase N-terminal [Marinobacter gudaonensis]
MFKKTLISLAVASSLGLTGCFDSGSTGKNANPDYRISNPAIDGKTWPIFNPVTSELPIPNDLIFDSVASDGTFRVADTSPPVTTALNSLSGASTVAPAVIRFNGQIDENSVDSRAFIFTDPTDPTSVIPNPNQNVFLIELDYASGDPVRGLSAGEPPTIPLALTVQQAAGGDAGAGAELAGLAASPDYKAEVVQLDGQSAIRINPLKPLDPQKRYVVVVTNEVLDINGDPVIQSPSYGNLTDENQPLGSSTLAPVRTLINSFWENIAANYFQVTNSARPSGNALSAANVAMSYSFTTSNDEKVLQYIAEPQAWFADQLTSFLRTSAASSVVDDELDLNSDGKVDYSDVLAAADGAVTNFPTAEIEAALDPIFAAAPPSGCAGLTGQNAINCVGFALANTPSANNGFADLLPTPKARSVTLDLAGTNDVTLASTPLGQIVSSGLVNIVQGTIEIPYFLGVPSGTNGSPLQTASWNADNTLASALNTAFQGLGLEIPQADQTVSDVVNYVFPFPEETQLVEVPLLVLYPSDGDVSGGTVIYQHGITTDRSAALTFGSALADAAKVAVVAIDQPLHGVTPVSQESLEELATDLLEAGQDNGLPASLAPSDSTVSALIAGQLNLSFVMSATGQNATDSQATIDSVLSGGTTGDAGLDAAIGFLGSAENTVANAGSTVPGIAATDNERHFNFYANAANRPVQMNFDPAVAAGEDESGSLFINLTNFLNGRDNLRQGSVDLMNLRASLGNIDFNGGAAGGTLDTTNVYFVGHSLGTINGSPFVAASNQNQINLGLPGAPKTSDDVVAANLLTPGGGIVRLLENSPTFAPEILGGLSAAAGLEQGDANLETYFNVFQAALDTVDPINFSDNHLNGGSPAGILLSEVIGDTVIPNSAGEGNTLGDAFAAPLAGTEPLATTLDASKTGVDGTLPAITRYTAGTHGTPVSADNANVFAEMVTQATLMIANFGASTSVVDDTVVED